MLWATPTYPRALERLYTFLVLVLLEFIQFLLTWLIGTSLQGRNGYFLLHQK